MKRKIIFRFLRIFFYILSFIYLLISSVKEEYSFIFCPLKGLFNYDCYLCGMTRAFISIFHLNFIKALEYNLLVIVFYPLLVFLALQDTYVIIKELITKKEKDSFVEYLVSKLWWFYIMFLVFLIYFVY